jgi:polar amino acid transport system substrate-binding protein
MRPIALIVAVFVSFGSALAVAAETLSAGWYAGEPQQFVQMRAGHEVLTGLDIEMVRAIAARADHAVTFEPVPFPRLMDEVGAGTRDIVPGTVKRPAPAGEGRFSRPYRQDVNVMVVRRGEAGRLPAPDVSGLQAGLLTDPAFRLGVRAGFSYVDPAFDGFIADPANADRVRAAASDAENLRRLLAGEIDGFLAERLSVALLIARSEAGGRVEEAALRLFVPLHLMFSPRVPPETVAAFDAAIAELEADGTLMRIGARFRLPALLSLSTGSAWFFALEVLGTVAAALAGYLAARSDRFSLFGALLLAALAAVGGGVIRDLLIGRQPIGAMATPLYALLILGTVALSWAVTLAWRRLGRARLLAEGVAVVRRRGVDSALFEIADALGLACFAMVGMAVAIGAGVQPLWLWGPVMATLTGAGGGILRDIVRGRGDIPNLSRNLYCEVPLVWSVGIAVYLSARQGVIEAGEMLVVVAIGVAGIALSRLAVAALGIGPPRLP